MKRIETLTKEAKAHLDANQYVSDYKATKNDVSPLQMARALDMIRNGERILRKAFG